MVCDDAGAGRGKVTLDVMVTPETFGGVLAPLKVEYEGIVGCRPIALGLEAEPEAEVEVEAEEARWYGMSGREEESVNVGEVGGFDMMCMQRLEVGTSSKECNEMW